ncbi:MAG: peptidylprolyl isomerase [Microscillaceae bacterium]|nr:peptidylprolyl isomerase [Microscillaceae bacterium]MDW8460904.1 peptidylprolyl isomerase [Cytophagales bacterium]
MKPNFYVMLSLSTSLLFFFNACKPTQKTTQPQNDTKNIILKIGKETVKVQDFKQMYEKSLTNPDSAYQQKHLENYLNLYINYKLKIIEAQSLGVDTTTAFKAELRSYEEQLAKTYLTDKKLIDSLVKQAYQRLQEEVNVSHVLIAVTKEAEPQDTLVAYEKILDLRKKVLEGKSTFEEIAQQYSQDTLSRKKGGNLGYFTALQMVYPFENASYNTAKGNISELIRTKFGYHFLKVVDRRATQGKVTIAHIMFKIPKKATKADSASIYQKAIEVYNRLQKGESWEMLCQQFSDDGASKDKGGLLPTFGVGTVIPEFEKAAFALQKEGDISLPFLSPSGYHIIKLIKKQGLEDFKEIEPLLRQKVTRDSRLEFTQQQQLRRLQKENNLIQNKATLALALQKADNRILQANWDYDKQDKLLKETLFSFENKALKQKKNYTIADFFAFAKEKQVPRPQLTTPAHALNLLYRQFLDNATIEFERSLLPLKYKDFQLLIQEYKEGMMLFQMMNENVWNKALTDESGINEFYQKNREKYRFEERADAAIFYCANEKVATELRELLKQKYYPLPEFKLEKIFFEKDKNTLSVAAIKYLDKIVTIMQDTTKRIEIAGFADPAEKADLAKKRIDPVVDYLLFKKVPLERIITKDYGIYKPVSTTDRSLNRRVEFTLFSTRKKDLEQILNQNAPQNLRVAEGKFQRGENAFVDKNFKKGIFSYEDKDGKVVVVEIKNLEPARLKYYEEAKGQLISDYQNHLENLWLDKLKQKYPIEINQEVFKNLIKK